MWANTRRLILLITLTGFALRLLLLDRFPLREDEAIYSFWALHGWLQDPLFLSVWPDKPPLFLWLLGAAFRTFGPEPASARWLNIAASTLTIPVIAVSARRLWDDHAALIAALVLALSPFAISFAPTAFVDPILVLFGSLALCLAIRSRPFAAGFFLGAAIMTKQQGLLYAPLVLMALIANSRPSSIRSYLRPSYYFILGLALILVPITGWDSLRWAVAPSPWNLSVHNYAAVTLLGPGQWLDRLQQWIPLLWHLTASVVVWLMLPLAAAVALVRNRDRTNTINLSAWMLAAWSLGFLLLHVTTSVQVWDRYLLPLTPMLALLGGWVASLVQDGTSYDTDRKAGCRPPGPPILGVDVQDKARLRPSVPPRLGARGLPPCSTHLYDNLRHRVLGFSRTPAFARMAAVAATAAILIVPAWQASTGALPIGGDHGAYNGLDEAMAWIDDELANDGKSRTVVYHDTLGWHHQFYLFEPVQSGAIDLRWFPSSTYLADNAEKTPHLRKFYVQPDWAARMDLAPRLAMRSLSMRLVASFGRFSVYEVVGTESDYCDWCLCGSGNPELGWQVLPLDGQRTVSSAAAVAKTRQEP